MNGMSKCVSSLKVKLTVVCVGVLVLGLLLERYVRVLIN